MIPQRFITPLVVAAALHAALFAVFPERPPVSVIKLPVYVPIDTLPPLPPEFFDPPPERTAGTEANSGGAAVPQIREPLAPVDATEFQPAVPAIEPRIAPAVSGPIPVTGPGWGDGPGMPGLPHDVLSPDTLDRQPNARMRVPPEYPYEAKRIGIEGEVEVGFVVGPDGVVRDAYIVRSSHRVFEAAAVRAVLRWKFEPGQYRGRPVAFRMSVPIVFRLDENR